jgi:hypothetical protein
MVSIKSALGHITPNMSFSSRGICGSRSVTPRVTKILIKSLELKLSLKARANQVVEV